LGLRAYPENVRSTGIWNSDHVSGPLSTGSDIDTFRALARPSAYGTGDLSDTLLLVPCSAAKRGQRLLHMKPRSLIDFLGPEAASELASGRRQAFTRCRLDPDSEPITALARYSGQPYKTEGVIDGLLDAMARGLHVLIVSGGYGLLRAEEPIHDYHAQMGKTLPVWRSRIPTILRDYVRRNGIARTFGTFSQKYGEAVPDHLTEEDWRAVPTYHKLKSNEPALKVVPQRVAQLMLKLLRHPERPPAGWIRT
jgi:hypothetical protein